MVGEDISAPGPNAWLHPDTTTAAAAGEGSEEDGDGDGDGGAAPRERPSGAGQIRAATRRLALASES